MHIDRPYPLNKHSFLILFRSTLFKVMHLSAEGNPCSIAGVSVPLSLLTPWNQDLCGYCRKLRGCLTNTQHEQSQIQSEEGKRLSFRALLGSFVQFCPLNMQSMCVSKFTSLYCCLLLCFNIIMRSCFGMCVSISLNGSVSVTIAQGENDHCTPGK